MDVPDEETFVVGMMRMQKELDDLFGTSPFRRCAEMWERRQPVVNGLEERKP
jgi:hypothetical protein